MLIKKSSNFIFSDFSLWILIISNLVACGIALKEGYNLSVLVWVYWFQSLTIGFFNFLKILNLKKFSTDGYKINGHAVQASQSTKIFTAYFFLIHYGAFHIGYGGFLLMGLLISSTPETIKTNTGLNLLGSKIGINEVKFIIFAALLFFINHLFSYLYNKSRDIGKRNIGSMMLLPYIRILPMHVIIIFGSTLSTSLLPLFLLLKVISDTLMHIVEHKIRR